MRVFDPIAKTFLSHDTNLYIEAIPFLPWADSDFRSEFGAYLNTNTDPYLQITDV